MGIIKTISKILNKVDENNGTEVLPANKNLLAVLVEKNVSVSTNRDELAVLANRDILTLANKDVLALVNRGVPVLVNEDASRLANRDTPADRHSLADEKY